MAAAPLDAVFGAIVHGVVGRARLATWLLAAGLLAPLRRRRRVGARLRASARAGHLQALGWRTRGALITARPIVVGVAPGRRRPLAPRLTGLAGEPRLWPGVRLRAAYQGAGAALAPALLASGVGRARPGQRHAVALQQRPDQVVGGRGPAALLLGVRGRARARRATGRARGRPAPVGGRATLAPRAPGGASICHICRRRARAQCGPARQARRLLGATCRLPARAITHERLGGAARAWRRRAAVVRPPARCRCSVARLLIVLLLLAGRCQARATITIRLLIFHLSATCIARARPTIELVLVHRNCRERACLQRDRCGQLAAVRASLTHLAGRHWRASRPRTLAGVRIDSLLRAAPHFGLGALHYLSQTLASHRRQGVLVLVGWPRLHLTCFFVIVCARHFSASNGCYWQTAMRLCRHFRCDWHQVARANAGPLSPSPSPPSSWRLGVACERADTRYSSPARRRPAASN